MRAKNKRGLPVPDVYVRHVLAQAYHCTPMDIGQWPEDEVQTALAILEIEAEADRGG